jgi:stearoyl-CoA desaturase (delta-9 desaturase)
MFSLSIHVPVSSKPPLIRVNAAVFIGLPIIALLAVPYWGFTRGYDGFQWLWAIAFLYLNGIGITGGYHRLWAHRAYEASAPLRWFYALWGAGALQNSILVWASDHRRHHRHVDDNERDPYSAGRGLWFSHMGWILREYRPQVNDFSNVPDLLRDPIVRWQHRHYVAITTFMNLGLPILLGWWHGDIIGCVLLVGLGRLIVNHHVTFFINSLAHFWGKQPYTDENSARDNGFLAFLTYGEGYHNFHHLFQNDYRNGVRWWQWDPTKWFIGLCSTLGLARRLQRVPHFKIQRAILAQKFRQADRSLVNSAHAETLRIMLEREYQLFAQSVNEWKSLQTERYERGVAQLETALDQRKQKLQYKWQHAALRMRLQELEYSLKMQRKRLELLILQAASTHS